MELTESELKSVNTGGFYLTVGRERDFDIFINKTFKDSNVVVSRIIRGRRCSTSESLFQEFAAALQFPYYFGNNWDAFDECIADLSWLPADKYLLFCTDLDRILSENANDLNTFFILIKDAILEWSKNNEFRKASPFLIIFHCEKENEKRCLKILEEESIQPSLRYLKPYDNIK